MYRHELLAIALSEEYNNEPGITTKDGQLNDWPQSLGERPSDDELQAIVEKGLPKHNRVNDRKNAYPSVEEQLAALWEDIDSSKLKRGGAFHTLIRNVYDKFPIDP